jgi:hypothetical protein
MGIVTAKLRISNPRDRSVDVNPANQNMAAGISMRAA